MNADSVAAIVGAFRRMFAAHFPLHQIQPVDAFGGTDEASMAADNTSAFNYWHVNDTTVWSQHAYGRAIDVNPLENPDTATGQLVLLVVGGLFAAAFAWLTQPVIARSDTVYACPNCETRYLGEQRCDECNTWCRRVGPGGLCPCCDEPVAVTDLLTPDQFAQPASAPNNQFRLVDSAPKGSQKLSRQRLYLVR
ncbi:MAG TPA: M15 family metallopeptidase [Acidimicrobiia bacterium]